MDFLSQFADISRTFQYDYVFVDAAFLVGWLALLFYFKKWKALVFGFIIAPLLYYIDAVVWWNTLVESGTYIREYWIGGTPVAHPPGELAGKKFGADFMMTVSYALFTFSWLWIMFEHYWKRAWREVAGFTAYYVGAWLLVPFLSLAVALDDTVVETVRHMGGRLDIWVLNIVAIYVLLYILYGTDLLNSKEPQKILWVFVVSVAGALIMELPLWLSGVRPTGIGLVLFEGLILLNQGVPHLFIIYDKLLRDKFGWV